ncbi:MAG TPA: NAD(+)/NADH kinase [Candidatus Acidoferrum sp.]|nr:NAD(+)/NADH kinase [Candidatus Acidoferrum sp.]
MPDAVGIVCHPQINIGGPPVTDARRRLEEHGYRVWTYCSNPNERPGALTPNLDGTRLIVSIGGDGTMLWTAEQAAIARIPVLGINAGRLGFLTQVQLGDEDRALDRWVAGDYTLQRRALLEVRVGDRVFHALNDAVVHKGIEINLIRLEVDVDGKSAGQFDADGVIISTPTGSTGYALSLGGPIVHPEVRALIFMPLNPHSLFNRPIVLPEQAKIVVKLPAHSAILTCDGQQNADLRPGTELQIAVGLGVSLVQFNGGPNFFDLLRRKLRWGTPLVDGDGE